MSPRALIPVMLAAGLVLVVLLLGFLGVGPAGRDLVHSAALARLEVDRSLARIDGLAGPIFAADLEAATHGVRRELERVRAELRRSTTPLDVWFADAGVADATPDPARFSDRYGFHRDELIRRLDTFQRASGVGVDPPPTIALTLPSFLSERRPPTLDEMKKAQHLFHLEARLYTAAAKHGGLPSRALEWTPGWRSVERGEDRFVEEKVVLHLIVPPTRPGVITRALVELEGGPITRLLGVGLEEIPAPVDAVGDGTNYVALRVALAVCLYDGTSGAH